MGYMAYSLRGVLASVGGISSTLAVGLAGVVVVVTVVLVFIMLLRSNGAGKRTASGLGYDAQPGQYGQPPNDPNMPWPAPRGANAQNAQGWPQTDHYEYGSSSQNPPANAAAGAGWDQNFAGQAGSGAQAQQGGWNNAPAQGAAWAGQAASGGRNAGQNAPAWAEAAQAWGNDQWGQQNNQSGWDAQPSPSGRLAANPAAGWESGRGGAGAASSGAGQWGGQAGMDAGWGPQAAAPQQNWAGNAAPAAPAGAAWGGNAPGYDSGYGEGDKTRIVRPNNGQQRIGMIVIRQGKEPGRVFELRKDRLTIGRSRESDIFLEDLAVSRLHTTVNSDGNGHYIIRDEGSANGTYVNQQRITEQSLEEGDEIQVGQTVLAFVRR